jgi:outer membrane PBP1 activator LpoA protein
MNGPSKSVGNDIKASIEAAFLRKSKENIHVSFYDMSGEASRRDLVVRDALNSNPDVIIGPLFAEDANFLRNAKPSKTPVISFTSDVEALGDNVITMNLIPTQSIETIVKQMKADGAQNMVILAPDDKSGKRMASVATKISDAYDMPINGLFYYKSGDSDSIKETSIRVSMYNARSAANTRAREVLSDIINKESLDRSTRINLRNQLEKISRTETLGKLPYDAILFLGSGEDTKAIASFLRYYGVGTRDTAMYGTTLWNNSDIASDFTLSGAKYATLPPISDNFVSLYNMISGKDPDYLAAFGYDAANLSLGILYTNKLKESYLFDPSGYVGTTGMFRVQPSGESERALRIMELNGSGEPAVSKEAPTNFLTPLYSINASDLKEVPEKELKTRGINPGDYITIPESLRRKSQYRTKTIGANYISDETEEVNDAPIQIYASDEKETVSNEEYKPVKMEKVSRKYIDSVEVTE